uniref:Uncharacterized protein n=1 Tax=Fagus sylvatica TaxID=28930 RepID=A0A2N9GKD1_FAGSY
MLPPKTGFDSLLDHRAGFRVSGRSPAVEPKSFDRRTARAFPVADEILVDSSWRGRPCRHRGGLWQVSLPSCGYKLIMVCLRPLLHSGIPTHCCFSIGEVDLVPTLEEYAGLLQLDSPFSETPVIPIRSPRSNRVLEKYLGLDFCMELARDFIAGKKGWKKFRINAFKIAFAGIFLFPTSAGRIDLGVIPIETGRGGSDVLHTAPPALVLQSPAVLLPPARPLIILRGIRSVDALGLIVLSSMECLFLGCGVVQATIPALLFVSLAVFSTRLVLGDLDAVTFDYIPSEDMWRLLFRIEDIWGGHLSEIVLIEDGLQYGQVHHILWCLALFGFQLPLVSPRGQLFWRESLRRLELSWHHYALPGHLRERSLRLVWSPCGAPLHHNSVAVANLRRDLEVQRGNVSTLRTMNDFIREQLEISEAAKDHMEETLAETQGQLETEQVGEDSRSRMSLILFVHTPRLWGHAGSDQRSSRVTMESCRLSWTWCMMLLSPMLLGSIQEGFPVVTALHQINQVMDSLGARARAVLEEHDEGDPALSTALGRFCRETCIRLGR